MSRAVAAYAIASEMITNPNALYQKQLFLTIWRIGLRLWWKWLCEEFYLRGEKFIEAVAAIEIESSYLGYSALVTDFCVTERRQT